MSFKNCTPNPNPKLKHTCQRLATFFRDTSEEVLLTLQLKRKKLFLNCLQTLWVKLFQVKDSAG